MGSSFKIDVQKIEKNIQSLQAFMQDNGIAMFYISSFDQYLNEYVPMIDCHRFYLTGFSGSVAEVLVPSSGRVKLYVDGRYHEQADNECDAKLIDVVKVPQNKGVLSTLWEDLEALAPNNVAIEGERTAVSFYEKLETKFDVDNYQNGELANVIDFEKMPALGPVKSVEKKWRGSDTSEKLKKVFAGESNAAYFVTAIDSLAWITNCRGYHLPNLSSFLGKALVVADKVYVFVGSDMDVQCEDKCIEWIKCDETDQVSELDSIVSNLSISKVYIDKSMLNTRDYLNLKLVFSEELLVNKVGGLVEFHSIKDEGEIKAYKDSFKRGDKAIYNTIKWIKEQVASGKEVTELDLYNKTSEMYEAQGAITQSFNTIAGAGANGSIIHYSASSAEIKIKEDTMCLLDSGGYFEPGFATDTTRAFLGGSKVSDPKCKEIYTLVLKGTLALQNAVFKAGTRGVGLDAICRQPLFQAGYDFAHGTGHGVGIHVHEGGVGIGPTRNYLLKPGQVVSIEPGIYIPGFGGVRLENIGLVKEHPEFDGFLCFEPLVYIGFEPELIDEDMLNEAERKWLEEYEAVCSSRGTSFRN